MNREELKKIINEGNLKSHRNEIRSFFKGAGLSTTIRVLNDLDDFSLEYMVEDIIVRYLSNRKSDPFELIQILRFLRRSDHSEIAAKTLKPFLRKQKGNIVSFLAKSGFDSTLCNVAEGMGLINGNTFGKIFSEMGAEKTLQLLGYYHKNRKVFPRFNDIIVFYASNTLLAYFESLTQVQIFDILKKDTFSSSLLRIAQNFLSRDFLVCILKKMNQKEILEIIFMSDMDNFILEAAWPNLDENSRIKIIQEIKIGIGGSINPNDPWDKILRKLEYIRSLPALAPNRI